MPCNHKMHKMSQRCHRGHLCVGSDVVRFESLLDNLLGGVELKRCGSLLGMEGFVNKKTVKLHHGKFSNFGA